MADICMCQYDKCERKDNCYRFKAKAKEYQSYAEFQTICNEKTNYEYYWQMDKDIIKTDKEGE